MAASLSTYQHIYTRLSHLFPNLTQASILFYDQQNGAVLADLDGNSIETRSFEDYQNVIIQKYRAQAQSYQWLSPEELPWENIENVKPQASFDDEIKKTILMVSLPGQDGQKDCIFIFLSPYLSAIIPSTADAVLRSDQKNIIATMTKKSIESAMQMMKEHHQKIKQIKSYYTAAEQQIEDLQTRNKKLTEQYANSVRAIVYKALKKFATKQFEVPLSVIELLMEKQLPSDRIEQVVIQSVQQLMTLFPEKTVYQLSKHHIVDTTFDSGHEELVVNTRQRRNEKAFQMLEKYEDAAIALLSKNRKVNGKNIAQYLKVTPPAITDAFKKNEKSIAKALEQNPNRWFQIRNHLRPVQRIVAQIERKAS